MSRVSSRQLVGEGMTKQTIAINGTIYDSQTGKPLRKERGASDAHPHDATQIHTRLQRSQTLNRKYVHREPTSRAAKSTTPREAQTVISVHRKPSQKTVTRSEQIQRFAAHTPAQVSSTPKKKISPDIAPMRHRTVERAQLRLESKKQLPRAIKPSQVLKREAIAEATAKMPAKQAKKESKQPKTIRRATRFMSLTSASLGILLLGGYLTYLTMPSISTRVAASQAGINASYPSYQPTGYSLSGPVAYQQGSVAMKFAANSGPQAFVLSQARSTWDSAAVLDNYVTPKAGNDYSTTATGGLTIYTYGTNSVWVNNGVLYTISGDAPLSNDQIQRIATSL